MQFSCKYNPRRNLFAMDLTLYALLWMPLLCKKHCNFLKPLCPWVCPDWPWSSFPALTLFSPSRHCSVGRQGCFGKGAHFLSKFKPSPGLTLQSSLHWLYWTTGCTYFSLLLVVYFGTWMPTLQNHHPQTYPQCSGHTVMVFCTYHISIPKLPEYSGRYKPVPRTAWITIFVLKAGPPSSFLGPAPLPFLVLNEACGHRADLVETNSQSLNMLRWQLTSLARAVAQDFC